MKEPFLGYHPCCRPKGHGNEACQHEKGYLQTEGYVERQVVSGHRVKVIAPSGDAQRKKLSWQVGETRLCLTGPWPKPAGQPHEIVICRTAAVELYGWDMVTSVLIHEFGHCKLYEATGKRDDHTVKTEKAANEMGRDSIRKACLFPERYDLYRAFFLMAYETPGNWTEPMCRAALAEWAERLW